MAINITEIQTFIAFVESQTDKKYQTPTDFEQLSSDIFLKTKNHISVSTLKRLWGYIQRPNRVRKSTLDILANYVGHTDFDKYCRTRNQAINSGFLDEKVILSAGLNTGTILEIGWEPDRLCHVTYQGDNYFQISKASNTALKVGVIYRISVFSLGEPLYLEDLSDESNEEKVYIAGKNSGLTVLRIIDDREQLKRQ